MAYLDDKGLSHLVAKLKTTYATSTHNHNITSLNNVSVTLKNVTTGGWSVISDDYAKGTWLKVVKGANNAPAWYAQKYASGLAFGVGDIKGVLSLSNSLAKVCFASGGIAQGTPSWHFTLTGTAGKEYSLDNIPTSKMASLAALATNASLSSVVSKVNALITAMKAAGLMKQ